LLIGHFISESSPSKISHVLILNQLAKKKIAINPSPSNQQANDVGRFLVKILIFIKIELAKTKKIIITKILEVNPPDFTLNEVFKICDIFI
jgi:hypothetical protein